MKSNIKIAMEFQTTQMYGGGPYISSLNIINSNLSDKYSFAKLKYNNDLGRGISISRILDLKKQIELIKPDIVHFGGLQLSGFHMAIACKLAGIKNTIVTIHGFSSDCIYLNPLKGFILKYFIEFPTLIMVRKIVGVSQFVINRKILQFFKKKCYGVIYNFPPTYKELLKSKSIRKELNISTDDIIFVTVSRITKEKGIHLLTKVIPTLTYLPNIKFIIVGEGDYLGKLKEELANEISRKIVYPIGFRADIMNILKECDVFVLPTLHETLSIALLEASTIGLPMIATNTGGIPEIITNNENGLLFPVGDFKKLKENIIFLYNNRFAREQMGQKARTKIENSFKREEIEEKLNNLYQSFN